MPMRSVGTGAGGAGAAAGTGAAVRAIARMASRSTAAQTASRIAAMRACASPASLAGMSPRWRSTTPSRGSSPMAPSTGMRVKRSMAARSFPSWRAPPTRLRITPAIRSARIEGREPVQQRRRAARHAAGVEHEDDGHLQPARQRGVAVGPLEVHAVVQAEVALDHGHVAAGGVPGPVRGDLGVALQVRVEVAAGATGREAEPLGIDVVGALLEGLDRQPARGQPGDEAGGDRRLAGRPPGGGDQECAHGQRARRRQGDGAAAGDAASSGGRIGSARTPASAMRKDAARPPRPSRSSGRLGT